MHVETYTKECGHVFFKLQQLSIMCIGTLKKMECQLTSRIKCLIIFGKEMKGVGGGGSEANFC